MSRIPYILIENFDEDQKTFFKNLTQGKRAGGSGVDRFLTPEKGVKGPFNAWLYRPKLGDTGQRLGEMLRYEGVLPPQSRELAILVVAAEWEAEYEWWAHEKIGKAVGLEEGIIASIKEGKKPLFKDSDQAVVYDFTRELIKTRDVSDSMYHRAIEALGEAVVVELVILIGYYTLISMTMNVFRVPLPEGDETPIGIVDGKDG
ncbi:MAG TPA: carboxymuconolactone decarboxylase family protein [Deltaproteobacteria bacterium]|nr:carboxymuconolactone decarboxylase family protein [Deltaproteobacteria bacterium]